MMLAFVAAVLLSSGTSDGDGNWSGWRGPGASGVASGSPPVEWSESKNVRWKAPLPGKGLASPIVWGTHVFVATAVPTGKKLEGAPAGTTQTQPPGTDPIEEQEFVVLALERKSGAIAWDTKVATLMPHETTHPDGSYASPTCVTDGEHVYASFGSFGIYCLSMDGKLAWQVDLGDMKVNGEFGEGSSPVLYGGSLILSWDHEGDSFLIALDKQTGKERWRTPRPRGTSWATPLVVQAGAAHEIVMAGARTIAYDAETGRELWHNGETPAEGGGAIASPVAVQELVLVAAGGRGGEVRALVALPPEESGPEAEPLLWKQRADGPSIPSPVAYDGMLYFLKNNSGMLSAMDSTSGEVKFGPQRLQGVSDVYASPVVASGHLYVAGRDGTVEVLSTWPEIKTLAVNRLEDGFDASPAIAGDELYLRGKNQLYCIAAGK